MAEKFGKMKCLKNTLVQYTVMTPYSTMKTRHIKRNRIVQIEIFIGYETKLF
jgi:hypothetical protein